MASRTSVPRRLGAALVRHWVWATVVAVAIAGAAYWAWPRVAGRPAAFVHPEVREVVQTVVSTGRVRPRRIRLVSLAAGAVREVRAGEGDRVSSGELLVQLDDREASAALASARAQLAEATARKHQLHTVGTREAEEAVTRARTNLDEAQLNLERVESLVAGGAATGKMLDQARTTASVAESALRTATAQLDDVRSSGGKAQSVDAQVRQAEAAVSLAEARLANTRIEAPEDGVVISRSVEPGDVLQPGNPVMELAADKETELVASLDERNLSLLEVGQSALASADAYPDRTFPARLTFIAPIVDERRGTVEVRLAVPQPPDYLRPDMTVSVDILVKRKPGALVLPMDAVRDLATSPWALVIEDGRARRRALSVGAVGKQGVEILDGVSAGDRVIPITQAQIQVGDPVRPEERP